jgi:dUTP pyrophosphatase
MGESVICPHDGHVAHEIFWCDNIRRWFCPHCRRVLNEVEYECRCGHLVRRDTVDEKKAEQQRLFAREVGSAEIELVGLVRRGKGIKAKRKEIPYKAINNELPAFFHAHENDAGYDLYSAENLWIRTGETETIQTNLRVCIPEGYVGLVTGRSGNSSRGLLCHLGTIDAGYTGPIWVVLSNLNHHMVEVKRGDRVAQLVILRLPEVELSEGDLPETERGKKGLGSTGR